MSNVHYKDEHRQKLLNCYSMFSVYKFLILSLSLSLKHYWQFNQKPLMKSIYIDLLTLITINSYKYFLFTYLTTNQNVNRLYLYSKN